MLVLERILTKDSKVRDENTGAAMLQWEASDDKSGLSKLGVILRAVIPALSLAQILISLTEEEIASGEVRAYWNCCMVL